MFNRVGCLFRSELFLISRAFVHCVKRIKVLWLFMGGERDREADYKVL